MKKVFIILLLLLVFTISVQAEDDDRIFSINYGIETDLFSWRIGELFENIFISAWIGIPHWKFAVGAGAIQINSGHLPEYVQSYIAYPVQIQADWFFNKDLKGFWFGPSLLGEFADLVSTESYKSKVFFLSGGFTTGYLFKAGHVYFGPSVSVHFTMGKPVLTVNEGNTYPLPPWSFETGFRFGYQF